MSCASVKAEGKSVARLLATCHVDRHGGRAVHVVLGWAISGLNRAAPVRPRNRFTGEHEDTVPTLRSCADHRLMPTPAP